MKRNFIIYLVMVFTATSFTLTSCGDKNKPVPVPKGPTGKLEVTVMDDNGTALKDITVQLAYNLDSMSNSLFFKSGTTDAAGKITFSDVRTSKVYVYAKSGTLNDYKTITIKKDETVTVELTLLKTGDLNITVRIGTDLGMPAVGADVSVALTEADLNNGTFLASGQTNQFGQILFPNLPVGTIWAAGEQFDNKGIANYTIEEGKKIDRNLVISQ